MQSVLVNYGLPLIMKPGYFQVADVNPEFSYIAWTAVLLSKHRAVAVTKRGAAVAVNDREWRDRFVLIFLASFFASRQRMKWG